VQLGFPLPSCKKIILKGANMERLDSKQNGDMVMVVGNRPVDGLYNEVLKMGMEMVIVASYGEPLYNSLLKVGKLLYSIIEYKYCDDSSALQSLASEIEELYKEVNNDYLLYANAANVFKWLGPDEAIQKLTTFGAIEYSKLSVYYMGEIEKCDNRSLSLRSSVTNALRKFHTTLSNYSEFSIEYTVEDMKVFSKLVLDKYYVLAEILYSRN
jgi:hypothetical protein